MELSDIYPTYGVPDPSTVSWLSKGAGPELAYVGHGEITRILCEIDPSWTWEPLDIINGAPAIHIHEGLIPRKDKEPLQVAMATMWGKLTLLGVTRVAVGSVEAHKPDRDKELVSDFLRNAAMRFGIALSLWTKDAGHAPATPTHKPAEPRNSHPSDQTPDSITDGQIRAIYAITKALDRLPAPGFKEFTKRQAMQYLDELKAEQMRKAAEAPEEPF